MSDISEDELRSLYFDDWLEVEEIAEELGLGAASSVYYWLDKYDISTRNHLQIAISHDQRSGYELFQVNEGGSTNKVKHHRLLATLKYEPDELEGKHIHHKNGIPWDNRLENLELIEPGEHAKHHHKGTEKKNTHLQKLTDEEVVELVETYNNSGKSYRDLADEYDISDGHVGRLVNGKSKRVKSIEALQ